ncbi:MAG TPA: ribbon-helix-helix protein, CopG family [Vicinamibacterales bacterium]|nr:ribbon-helix-helix protein, CopG family [Vicinamibacterales bacterium]
MKQSAPAKDERVSTSFKVSDDLRTELKIAAARERRDMSDLLEDALRQYLSKTQGGSRASR